MTAEAHGYLIRGGRIYDHDGDIHQPKTADLLIDNGVIERIAPRIDPDDGAVGAGDSGIAVSEDGASVAGPGTGSPVKRGNGM